MNLDRADLLQESGDLAGQRLGLGGERADRVLHGPGGSARLTHLGADIGDLRCHQTDTFGGLLDVAGDLAGRGTLLIDRLADLAAQPIDVADRLDDALDAADRVAVWL
jgi:hypothetical protein